MVKILLVIVIVLLIMALSIGVFAVGFFIGYTREDKRLYKKATQGENEQNLAQKAREEKAKREWQRFLNYDGSSNIDERNLK